MDEKKIWTPEAREEKPKRVTISASIIGAKYHPLEKAMIIAVRLPNGKAKSMPNFPQNYTFQGRPSTELTTAEIDAEMEKTAELYRRCKGRQIKIEIDETELE